MTGSLWSQTPSIRWRSDVGSTFTTPAEVAERWQCTPEHVQRLCARGELRAMKLGRRGWRIPMDAVEAYELGRTTAAIEQRTAPKPAPKEVAISTAVGGFALPADYEPVFPTLWPGHVATTKKTASVRS